MWVLLPPPGVFGRVETGQVFVLFDNIHLFTGPEQKENNKNQLKGIQICIFSFRSFKGYIDVYVRHTLLLHTLHMAVQHFDIQSETPLRLCNVQAQLICS